MPAMTVAVCLVLALAAALVYSDEPSGDKYDCRHDNTVHTTHGRVQGQTLNIPVNNGRHVTVDAYWGIPYAQTPVEDLRFRRPVAADPWDGVLQAKTPPNSCVQVLFDTVPLPNPTTPLSEDCLYLNIFRPSCNSGRRGLAIMFWLHPGFFSYGSSTVELFNGTLLAASECVIVVSVNYRLGALGFLYVGNDESPGNMALEDAALALAWFKQNAARFHGDANRITLFGNSAGSSIASLFILSPRTRGLFNNAILQSGTTLTRFTHQTRQSAMDAALELARRLNCSSQNRTAIVRCLRQVAAADLALQHLVMTSNIQYRMVTITDGFFLTQDPLSGFLAGDYKHCDIMTGTANNEGAFGLALALPQEYNLRRPDPPSNISDQEINQTLSTALSLVFKPEAIPGIIEGIKDTYDLERLRREVPDPTLRVLMQALGDLVFVCPARLLAAIVANTSQRVYVYSFNHARDNSTLPPWVGATHTLEIPFVFGTTSRDFPVFSRRERDLSGKMMRLWANFAKYGNPTLGYTAAPTWPTYSPPDPASILEFSQSAEVRLGRTESRRCAFWNSLPPEDFLN